MRDYSKITKPTPEHYCDYCGKKMERKRINGRLEDLGAFKRRKYCNRMCMRKAFVKTNGEGQSWSSAHHSAREIEYLINGMEKVCEVCGSTRNVDIHHKDGNHQNNDESNLMLVCRSCHNKLHKPKSKCKICGRIADGGHGYCNMHYIRWKRYGNPLIYQGKIVDGMFTERGNKIIETDQETQQLTLF